MAAIYFRQQVLPAIYKIGHVALPAMIDQVVYRVLPRRPLFLGTLTGLAGVVVLTPKSLRTVALGVYLSYKALQVYLLYRAPRINQEPVNPFYDAIKNGNLEDVKTLWERATQEGVSLLKEHGNTPIHVAVLSDKLDIAQWLISQDRSLLNRADDRGWTPLHMAVSISTFEFVQWLTDQPGILLDCRIKESGLTPLHLAVSNNKIEMAHLLNSKDSLLKYRTDDHRKTPWQLAKDLGKEAVFFPPKNQTDTQGSAPTSNNLPTPKVSRSELISQLQAAVKRGELKTAEKLWTQNPTLLNEVDKDGWTLFHYGADNGQLEMVEAIWVQAPSLLSKVDNEGETPLHNAAASGELEVLKWLDSKDPSLLKKRGNEGRSVFDWAVCKGHIDVMVWILDKDASMLTANSFGWTPFHSAAQGGYLQVLDELWKLNSTLLNHADMNGNTPLHVAANEGRLDAVKWICQQSPNQATVKNIAGFTAYQVAMGFKHPEVAEWLKENHPASN